MVLGTILLFTLCIFSVSSVSGQGEISITRIKVAQIQMYPRFAFDFPTSVRSLTIYESSLETGENKKIRIQPKLQKVAGGRNRVKWVKRGIHEGQSFRFEWN